MHRVSFALKSLKRYTPFNISLSLYAGDAQDSTVTLSVLLISVVSGLVLVTL